jgi:hypothetical protein
MARPYHCTTNKSRGVPIHHAAATAARMNIDVRLKYSPFTLLFQDVGGRNTTAVPPHGTPDARWDVTEITAAMHPGS